jgi:hypothetical protein
VGYKVAPRLATAFAVAVAVAVAVGCGGGNSPDAKSSTTSTAPPPPPAPPLGETALTNVLLTAEEVNAAMGVANMAVANTRTEMSDDSATMEPKECLALDGAAQSPVYAGSFYTAERDQSFNDGDQFKHFAEQAVVLFASAQQANDFFKASAQQWPACPHYTHTQSGTQWDVAPISNANGMLSTVTTQQQAAAPGWACGRALTARNNVVIDVNTCSTNPGDTAVNIASQIATKVGKS